MPYKSIFLIDDDEDDRDFFLAALDELSGTVVCTSFDNATMALRTLETVIPDAIFLDWNMPVMNGEDFLIATKGIPVLQDIPIIVISTTSHESAIRHTKKLGAHHFITKPNKFSELVDLLKPFIN